MHPTLFEFGSLRLSSYWGMIALGYLAGTGTAFWLARRSGVSARHIAFLSATSFFVGVVGAFALQKVAHASRFLSDPSYVFQAGGRAFLGGPLLVIPCILWYCSRFRIPVGRLADILIPGLTLALTFGRVGCFLAGCCHGCVTQAAWGVPLFKASMPAELRGVPLHPVQLYEAVGVFALYLLMLAWRRRRAYEGQVALLFFLGYPLLRFSLEYLRGDDASRGFLVEGWLSTSQTVSLLLFTAALVFVALRQLRLRRLWAEPAVPTLRTTELRRAA